MTRREEAAARDLALTFVNSTIPEYITAYGRSIEAEGHLGKFTLLYLLAFVGNHLFLLKFGANKILLLWYNVS